MGKPVIQMENRLKPVSPLSDQIFQAGLLEGKKTVADEAAMINSERKKSRVNKLPARANVFLYQIKTIKPFHVFQILHMSQFL